VTVRTDAFLDEEHALQSTRGRRLAENGRRLDATSMSFSIARGFESMAGDGSTLIQAADTARYEARSAGRDRATISRLAA